MDAKQFFRVYLIAFVTALLVFVLSVLLPILLTLFSMDQPPATIFRLFSFMNENRSQLDLLLLLTPLSFLYLFTSYRVVEDIRKSKIKDAETFTLFFVLVPVVYLLAYTFFVAFYFLDKRDLTFGADDFALATAGTVFAFSFLILLEIGIAICRIEAQSAKVGGSSPEQ